MNKNLQILLITALYLTSCATKPLHFSVGVNSFSKLSDNNAGKSFQIFLGNLKINRKDLEFLEYSRYVQRALLSKGFVKEDNPEKADILILLAYGIGDPEEHNYAYSAPVIGHAGIASKTGNIYSFGNVRLYSQKTTHIPQFGVAGGNSGRGSRATYSKYIYITAYDLAEYRKSDSENMIWETRIVSIGPFRNLKRAFPVMIAASTEYIGTNMNEVAKIELNENDVRVQSIKAEPKSGE